MDCAVRVDDFGLLGERRLGVIGGHAEQRDNPHPEDCAGAADEDSTASADDVSGADLRGDCGGKRLERAHVTAVIAARERKAAEHLLSLAEAAELHAPRADGEVQARADEQD